MYQSKRSKTMTALSALGLLYFRALSCR